MNHNTVFDPAFEIEDSDKKDFNYQKELTKKLDQDISDFDQNKLNAIVLWKVNRFASFDNETIEAINSIDKNETAILDIEKTRHVLTLLLKTGGVRLAMASTILRFRNPHIYQIIDQRVYRILYEDINPFKVTTTNTTDKHIESQIDLYLQYLDDLKAACTKLNIDFEDSDRVLYMADKRVNKEHKLRW